MASPGKRPPQRSLKQSQTILRLLFDSNPLPMWIFDRQTLELLEINDAAERKYGYPRADFLRMKITDLLPEEGRPRFLQYLTDMQDEAEKQSLLKHRDKNGRILNVDMISHAIHWGPRPAVLSVIHDVTEITQALLQRQSAAIRASMDGVALLDPNQNYIYVNYAYAKIHGYDSPQELVGKNWRTLYDEAQARRIEEDACPGVHGGGHWRGECIGRRKDGQPFPQEVSLTATEDGGCIFVVRDITERRMLEQERTHLFELEKLARAKAETANRAKDEFLALISHELRTPMAAMMGWMWLLRYGAADAPTRERAFDIIERNMKMQAQISEDLLDLSSLVTGKLKIQTGDIHLLPIIRSAMDVVRPASEAKYIKITLDATNAECVVRGDPERLQQIFWNLLSNAIKFTPQEGEVRLQLRRAGSDAEVTVSDNGQGIHPDFLPYLFDPFRQEEYSMTRKYRGLGLGLAIVRHLVEMHGGTVNASSPGQGQGSVFSVRLPICAVRPSSDAAKAAPRPPHGRSKGAARLPSLAGLHVLVVDDAPDNCVMIQQILEQAGARVTAVDGAAKAMKAMLSAKPDILVSDIMMPDEDGYALIRKIRALDSRQGGSIPAIALTACARMEDRELALLAGYHAYVTKPVGALEIIAAVADIAKRHSLV